VSGDFFWQPICVTHCSFSPVSEDVTWCVYKLVSRSPWAGRHQQTGYVRCSSLSMMLQNSID